MATKTRTRASKRSKPTLPATDGGPVCRWIEAYLVHADGDWFGHPFRLTPEQRRLIWRIYEKTPDGRRRYRRVLYGRPKGYGKTELAAALALAELAGPVAPLAPDIPVAAASFEQADLIFGAAKTMASEGLLAPLLEVYDNQILRRDGPGRMYRVAAVAGTNDGGRHTFRVADEVHEWEGRRERVHLVLTNGLAKRSDAWALDISTAGSDTESLIGRLYTHGKTVEAGQARDERLLFDWLEHPDPDCDLTSEQAVRDAVAVAYRDAGAHVNLDEIVARYYEIPEFEWRRYYLNQFTAAPSRWLPLHAWEARTAERQVEDGETIVVGFDGSYNRDTTCLVGCTPDGHLFVIRLWERPDGRRDWVVPRDQVHAEVERTFRRFNVVRFAVDRSKWYDETEEWANRYGSPPVFEFKQTRAHMVAACSTFYAAVVQGELTHNGDPRLAAHLSHATVKETADGAYITKESRDSPKRIDLAVAAVMAYETAVGAPAGEWFPPELLTA